MPNPGALWHHGHERARRIRAAEHRAYRAEVRQAMRAHRVDLAAALTATSRLLQYTSYASPAHRWFSHRIATVALRRKPWAVLQRVIEFYTLVSREPHRFPNPNSEHLGLAKAVLPMARGDTRAYPEGYYRKRYFLAAGRYIAAAVAGHAIIFVRSHLESPQ
jgi:hypothetical protein